MDVNDEGVRYLRLDLEDAAVAGRQMIPQAELVPAHAEAALEDGAPFLDRDPHRRRTAFRVDQDHLAFALELVRCQESKRNILFSRTTCGSEIDRKLGWLNAANSQKLSYPLLLLVRVQI